MSDILHYRKAIEDILEKARRDGMEVKLEKNILGNINMMIVDKKTTDSCRVRKLEMI